MADDAQLSALDDEDEFVYEEPLSSLDLSVLWNRLIELDFADKNAAFALEQDLYQALKKFPEQGAYSILLLQVQLILGNVERARSLAYTIWEQGGELPISIQLLYLQHLTSLHLFEMAKEIASSFVEMIDDLPVAFYVPLLNFSLAFQDYETLEILAARIEEDGEGPLSSFIAFCNQQNYWNEVKAFHDIAFQNVLSLLVDYHISFDMSKGYGVVTVVFTLTDEAAFWEKRLNDLIFRFCDKNSLIFYDNLLIRTETIAQHPRLNTIFLPEL